MSRLRNTRWMLTPAVGLLLMTASGLACAEAATVKGKAVMAGTNTPVQGRIFHATNERFEFPEEIAHTAQDGTFVITGLQPGKHYFAFEPGIATLFSVKGLVSLNLAPGSSLEDLVFEIAEGCAIRGQVLDAQGNPAPDCQIHWSPFGPYYRVVRTGPQGRFLIRNLPQSDITYKLEVGNDSGGTTSVEAGPVGKSKTLEDVVIRLPAPVREGTIRGVVVDPSGAPVSNAVIHVQAPGSHLARTNEKGQFETGFHAAGTFNITVGLDVSLENMASHVMCAIGEGDTISLREGDSVDGFRIVVTVPPYLMGAVLDENGTGIAVSVRVIGTFASATVIKNPEGRFAVTRLPQGPFLIEFAKEGYQARVLESGRDFRLDDHNLKVVLKNGPFKEDESVFAAVTGRPATDEEVARMPLAQEVRQREEYYRRMAAQTTTPQPKSPPLAVRWALPPGAAPLPLQIRVTGPAGNPINRIYFERVDLDLTGGIPSRRETATPSKDSPKQVLDGKDGVFTLAEGGGLVSADGTARELVLSPEKPSAEPLCVTLYPASRIAIRVVDDAGAPVSGVAACHPDDFWRHRSSGFYRLPTTNAVGVIEFDQLAPGTYVYRLLLPVKPASNQMLPPIVLPKPVVFNVEPGKEYAQTVVFSTPKEDSPEGILAAWRKAYEQENPDPEKLPRPDKHLAKKLAKLIAAQLDALPGTGQWECKEATELARVAMGLRLEGAAPAIRSLFGRWRFAPNAKTVGLLTGDPGSRALAAALAALTGDDAVDLFATTAADPGRPYSVRRDSVIALGEIGIGKSIAALRKLRDAAYAKPGAPQRKETYTHAERIAEAVIMTIEVIPDGGGKALQEMTPLLSTASVSEDYTTGEIHFSGGYASVQFHLRRFGEEWLVVRIGTMTCV